MECYHDTERKQECRTLKHTTHCRELFFSKKGVQPSQGDFFMKKTVLAQTQPISFLRIYEFYSCILWKFSRAIWSYCDVMFTKRKPDPEKIALSCAKWITS